MHRWACRSGPDRYEKVDVLELVIQQQFTSGSGRRPKNPAAGDCRELDRGRATLTAEVRPCRAPSRPPDTRASSIEATLPTAKLQLFCIREEGSAWTGAACPRKEGFVFGAEATDGRPKIQQVPPDSPFAAAVRSPGNEASL